MQDTDQAAEVVAKSQIQSRLDELGMEISLCREAVDVLVNRLGDVMRAEMADAPADSPTEDEAESYIGKRLRDQRLAARRIRGAIDEVLSRLEV